MAEAIKVDVALQDIEGMAFTASTPTGHDVTLDAGADHGGQNLGPRPMHLLLVGLGGCTGMDVINMLRKMRQSVEGYRLEIEGVRAEDDPKVYTHIRIKHIVTGDVRPDRLAKAIELSDTKYCSASAMLRAVADIAVEHEIRAAAG